MAQVLIAGAGAVGSVFGGFLRLAGHEVTLLGRRRHLEAVAGGGLHIEGLWGTHCATGFSLATDPGALAGRTFEAILVTVKSYDSGAMARAVAPHLAAEGVAISLQNGLGNAETLSAEVQVQHGARRVLAGRVIFGAELVSAGRVRVTVYADPVLVGAWPAAGDAALDSAARRWVGAFAAAGIPSAASEDIMAALWGKVLYSAALNPLGALLGVHYGALAENAHSRAIMDTVIDEAFAVALAEGVALPWASAPAYRALFYGRLVPSTFHHRSSMLQDLSCGKATEVDAINGQVWERGVRHGLATPANALLTRLVHAREATGTGGAP